MDESGYRNFIDYFRAVYRSILILVERHRKVAIGPKLIIKASKITHSNAPPQVPQSQVLEQVGHCSDRVVDGWAQEPANNAIFDNEEHTVPLDIESDQIQLLPRVCG